MEDRRLSENFWLKEFNYVEPEPELLNILQALRTKIESPIEITNSTRTIKEHIEIYRKKYGSLWVTHIPWESRHLSKYGRLLRAVDFEAKKNENDKYDGQELVTLIDRIAEDQGTNVGIGIGYKFIHLDIDREVNAKWFYKK